MVQKLASFLILCTLMPVSAELFIVAHRGASADAPENTLPAFQLAWEQGADAIEGDFHLTSDGEIVCIHDRDTEKTAGHKLVVAESTLADLRKLDVGSWKDEKWEGSTIPTLREVLDTLPNHGQLFLEIKCGPEIVPPLFEALDAHRVPDERITVISFQADVIKAIKESKRPLRANLLRGFKKRGFWTTPSRTKVLSELAACGADGLGTNAYPRIDEQFIANVHEAGCQHHVWTIDQAPTAQRFLDLGSVTITTNRPGALRAELGR